MVDNALVPPQSINARPAFQNLIVENPAIAAPPEVAMVWEAIEFTTPRRMNGERSPKNFPEIRYAAEILKNSRESL